MRDSIESWRPSPFNRGSFLSGEDLDRLVAVLKLPGLSEDERRKLGSRFDNALMWFHHERDDEIRPSNHLLARRSERITAASRHLCGLLGMPLSFDPDVNPVDQMPPALVHAIALGSARMAERDPDIPGPNLQEFVPQLQAMANLASGGSDKPSERQTPRGHEALTGLIFRFEVIYGELTGQPPRLSRDPVNGEPRGPLIRFLREALLLSLWETPSDEAIAGHHRKIKNWRKQNMAA